MIRVFIGSGDRDAVAGVVLADSLESHASRPIEIGIIDCSAHVVRDFASGEHHCLPERLRGRLSGATAFSFARFIVPELCGWKGRAIYCESDQLALADIVALWDVEMGDDALAAVAHADTRHGSPFQTGGHLSSVIVYENSRCRALDVIDITERIASGQLGYYDAISMSDPFLETYGLSVRSLHPRWNDLQVSRPDTAIVHFTDFRRRPWLHPNLPDGDRWVRAFLAAVDAGRLDRADLARCRRLGGISARIHTLPRVPPRAVGIVDRLWQSTERLAAAARRLLRGGPRRSLLSVGRARAASA